MWISKIFAQIQNDWPSRFCALTSIIPLFDVTFLLYVIKFVWLPPCWFVHEEKNHVDTKISQLVFSLRHPRRFLLWSYYFIFFRTKFSEHVYILCLKSNALNMHRSLFSKDITMQPDVRLSNLLCFVYRKFADLSAPRLYP